MKKLVGIVLTITMIMSLCMVSWAGTDSTSTIPYQKNDISVTGSFSDSFTAVYKVDVVWDAMNFTFTKGDETWDVNQHKYVLKSGNAGSWSDTNNKITVTNHSNVDVKTTLSYVNINAAGSFYSTNATTSEITAPYTVTSAISGTPGVKDAYLLLSGTPTAAWLANPSQALGTITISISN